MARLNSKSIKVLGENEIDKQRWDLLVLAAGGPLYSTYDYLSLCSKWEAIVFEEENEYQCGIPIPYRRRFGFKYVYQSPFACYFRCLSKLTDADRLQEFQDAWLEHLQSFRYVAKYFFREPNGITVEGHTIIHHEGLAIDLARDYGEILKGYSSHRKIDLKNAAKSGLVVAQSNDIDLFFKKNAELSVPKIDLFQPAQLPQMLTLWKRLMANEQLEIFLASVDEEIVSGTLVGKFGASLFSLASFSTAKGRKTNALTLIIDQVLKKYANSNYAAFDFGNRATTGIDDFKLGFGAKPYATYQMYRNSLPWFVKAPKAILNFFRVGVGSPQ